MTPKPEQISNALPHIRYEIESFLQTPDYDRSNKALEESVYFRKMAHCRALHHFFKTEKNKRKDDDVLSVDFGFPAFDVYEANSKEWSKRFNKDLMHLTYERLNRTPNTKPWPMDELFPPVAKRSKEFINHILTQYNGSMPDSERKLWERLKAEVDEKSPLQQNTSNVAAPTVSNLEFGRHS